MKTRNLVAIAGAAVLLTACIPSVNPFYTEKDLVFDSRLIGVWGDPKDADANWRFEFVTNMTYRLIVTEEKDKRGEFAAHLFKLGGRIFLDITPTKLDLGQKQATLVGAALIPGHLILRVRSLEPELKLDWMDWDWLKKHLAAHPRALKHRRTAANELVLTAETRELQRFVLKHLKEGELFEVDQPDKGLQRLTNAPNALLEPGK
jgi:hypothetical protein